MLFASEHCRRRTNWLARAPYLVGCSGRGSWQFGRGGGAYRFRARASVFGVRVDAHRLAPPLDEAVGLNGVVGVVKVDVVLITRNMRRASGIGGTASKPGAAAW